VLLDDRALHLLPPAEACPGPIGAYLEAPANTKAAQELYLRLLASPDFATCVATGSIVLQIVLHRVASIVFEGPARKDGDAHTRQGALLCAVIRRLKGNNYEGRGQQALSMLLRWSCEEMGPVDVIPARRLDVVEKACKMGGKEEGLRDFATTAMES